MLGNDSDVRRQIAREHAQRLADDYGRRRPADAGRGRRAHERIARMVARIAHARRPEVESAPAADAR